MQDVALLETGLWGGSDGSSPTEISTEGRRKGHLLLHQHSPAPLPSLCRQPLRQQSSRRGRENVSGVIVPDPQADDGKYLARHPRLPSALLIRLQGCWSFSGSTLMASRLQPSSGPSLRSALAASRANITLAFHSCFCGDVQAGEAADVGAPRAAGAATARLCRAALLLLGRLGKVAMLQGWFMSAGPHCATLLGDMSEQDLSLGGWGRYEVGRLVRSPIPMVVCSPRATQGLLR